MHQNYPYLKYVVPKSVYAEFQRQKEVSSRRTKRRRTEPDASEEAAAQEPVPTARMRRNRRKYNLASLLHRVWVKNHVPFLDPHKHQLHKRKHKQSAFRLCV